MLRMRTGASAEASAAGSVCAVRRAHSAPCEACSAERPRSHVRERRPALSLLGRQPVAAKLSKRRSAMTTKYTGRSCVL